jgi:hypothetical protein
MMKHSLIALLVVFVLLIGYAPPVFSGETGSASQQTNEPVISPPSASSPVDAARKFTPPPIKTITQGVYEIGGIRILKNEKQVEFSCKVNMEKGLLEYLIVGVTGKLHESLLRTDAEPYCLHIALLLIGLEGTNNPLSQQGDPRKPEGEPVDIWVQWNDGDQVKRARIEEWVTSKQDGNSMQQVQWIFTGSIVRDGVFIAQVEKSIVAVFHDPAALIDNPLPEGGSDEVWFVNEGKIPSVGTDVTVIIQKG